MGVQFEKDTGLDVRDPSHGCASAAAIAAGNAMQESGFSPGTGPNDVGGDSGRSHGMFQWNGNRLAALKAFAAERGTNWWDRDTQIDFLDREARAKVPVWPSQQGLGQAREISKAYEGYGIEGARVGNASRFYQMYQHRGSSPSTQPHHPSSAADNSHQALLHSGGARLSTLAAAHPVTTSSSSNSMHVVNNIDARGATDPHGIAREIQLALERSTSTMMAQSGQV